MYMLQPLHPPPAPDGLEAAPPLRARSVVHHVLGRGAEFLVSLDHLPAQALSGMRMARCVSSSACASGAGVGFRFLGLGFGVHNQKSCRSAPCQREGRDNIMNRGETIPMHTALILMLLYCLTQHGGYLVDSVQEVLLGYRFPARADGEHAGLRAHAADVGARRVGAQPGGRMPAVRQVLNTPQNNVTMKVHQRNGKCLEIPIHRNCGRSPETKLDIRFSA